MKLIATKEQPVEAKYTKRLTVSGLEGKKQSKIHNVKCYFESSELFNFYNPPQKSDPKGRRHKAGGFSASGPSGRIFEGGLKGNDQKK